MKRSKRLTKKDAKQRKNPLPHPAETALLAATSRIDDEVSWLESQQHTDDLHRGRYEGAVAMLRILLDEMEKVLKDGSAGVL